MLTTKKSITLTGTSTIDGVTAERYTANINEDDPDNMTVTSVQANKSLYKENRETCRVDRNEFEEVAYALQDEMIAAATE